jgi:hypothetical protein
MLDLFINDLNSKIKPRVPEYHHIHRQLERCVDAVNLDEKNKIIK